MADTQNIHAIGRRKEAVCRVFLKPGDEVRAGQGLIVMEAMKMENELRAVAAGRVKAVLAQPGMAVEKGALLVELE